MRHPFAGFRDPGLILAKQILYRGAGIDVVWRPFLALAVIGTTLFGIALARFRKTNGTMA